MMQGRAYNQDRALSLGSTATASFIAAAYADTVERRKPTKAFGFRCFALT